MGATRYWSDVSAGDTFQTGELDICEADIFEFAREFDPQPYHLDRAAAEQSIFGGLCASGWHTAALMMRLLTDALRAQALAVSGLSGVPALHWRQPVFEGDRLHADITVAHGERASRLVDSGILTLDVTVKNQHDKPVMALQVQVLVAHREAAAA